MARVFHLLRLQKPTRVANRVIHFLASVTRDQGKFIRGMKSIRSIISVIYHLSKLIISYTVRPVYKLDFIISSNCYTPLKMRKNSMNNCFIYPQWIIRKYIFKSFEVFIGRTFTIFLISRNFKNEAKSRVVEF